METVVIDIYDIAAASDVLAYLLQDMLFQTPMFAQIDNRTNQLKLNIPSEGFNDTLAEMKKVLNKFVDCEVTVFKVNIETNEITPYTLK